VERLFVCNEEGRKCDLRAMRYSYSLLTMFLVLIGIALYGCWADSDAYMMLHNHDNPFREPPWSEPAEFVAAPGTVVAFLVFNRTDIPENDPDSWQTAWLIAPSAAAIWIGLYVIASKACRPLMRYLRSKL
jgi:hypothetical protein